MGRLIIAALISLTMTGCAVVAAVSGTAVEGMVYMFKGEEESFSIPMRQTLVAVQRGLAKSGLHPAILEPVENGYMIVFGNDELDGRISLEKRTERLTTVIIKVKSGAFREDSVERALVKSIQDQKKSVKHSDRFDFRHYKSIHEDSDSHSKRVGWYLPGSKLDVSDFKHTGWLRVKMPSGKYAFLQGDLAASRNK